MVVTCVHVFVKPEHVDDFIAATKANHIGSVQEMANIRFDFLQDPDEPTKFMLYEAYETAEGAAAHKQTEHYLTWRETVAPWMAQPRQGKPYNVIAP
ncbi:antibiotic biosynthesis monooxygenase [Leptolyngbyaceae cyanobacterium CCMR0082]|uniref:Antibiotic biosynthesis monooxygenase n=2 Tax=Adonisia turfae TaxID=2950184 RepID=A0A6M0SBX3_9CYAN|nr:antibiotic biosynthesis monooxygenase [Adonisia turfae]MDV3352814.1 antibiotic biosynthesis monooxygenase [Leptothoe sp. LEGE 181152]NEZ59959.1 antibiotic biosynthesis monooxygenase [Adonisia turfae CCMR0081]NEZ65964.1 antibiotic biosynthesis monooxygenase [Adonisia turfae CCMR0082]